MSQDSRLILADADILSHFMVSGNTLFLPKIFKNKKIVLTIVADEIRRHPKFRDHINMLIQSGNLSEIAMPNTLEIVREFATLKKSGKGAGESACMAVARFDKNIIASNNFRDIKPYCELHGISYLSTMDFLYEAYCSKVMTLSDIDYMIYELITMKIPARIPSTCLEEYCTRNGKPFPI
ncbi:hypothetical protein [Pedobacter frigidisoli]|uniref:hypothetical protein n=1 Tax=Pedobacter frigidisoli TaxID=2530455 RepID=UPI00292F2863|nr:hypothetical protein [Pedobacter frigidisoli]